MVGFFSSFDVLFHVTIDPNDDDKFSDEICILTSSSSRVTLVLSAANMRMICTQGSVSFIVTKW